MWERVEPIDVERRVEKPRLVCGDVESAAPEELRPMGDVEGAELGGDDAGDAQPEVAHVG